MSAPAEWDPELGIWKGSAVPWAAEHAAAALPDPLFIFGYGSLCWKPSFPYEERCGAHVEGFVRRFWQRSTDHRGTPGSPGLVLTLVSRADLTTLEWEHRDDPRRGPINDEAFPSDDRVRGVAYRIPADRVEAVVRDLDVREQGGYSRCVADLHLCRDGEAPSVVRGLVYVALVHNPHFAYLPMRDCADIIAVAKGPSGHNADYLYQLHDHFAADGLSDDYLRVLVEMVRQRRHDGLAPCPTIAPTDSDPHGDPPTC
jgi:cation transport protein ChaC